MIKSKELCYRENADCCESWYEIVHMALVQNTKINKTINTSTYFVDL